MNEASRTLDDMMREVLEAMPPGPQAGKLATAVGALMKAAELPPEHAWCALAALVSSTHGGAPVAVVLSVAGEGDERQLVSFSSDGTVGRRSENALMAPRNIAPEGAIVGGSYLCMQIASLGR